MQLNDLLAAAGVDPARTLVLRHRPSAPAFAKVLPLLAGERLDLFEEYQSTQNPAVENAIRRRVGGWIAAFIAYGAGRAVYVGCTTIDGHRTVTQADFWAQPANQALRDLGNPGFTAEKARPQMLRFDLGRTDILADWRGKLVVGWPPPERGWYRAAERNVMPVLAIREESAFADALPPWDEMDFTWAELRVLPVLRKLWGGCAPRWSNGAAST